MTHEDVSYTPRSIMNVLGNVAYCSVFKDRATYWKTQDMVPATNWRRPIVLIFENCIGKNERIRGKGKYVEVPAGN